MIRHLAALAAAVALAATGCAVDGPTGDVLVVIGAQRTGEPAVTWTSELERRFQDGVDHGQIWTMIVPDGRPTVAGSVPLRIDTTNDLTARASTDALHEQVERLVVSAKATSPEVDLLTALDLAGRVLAASTGTRTIIVTDSLLQTVGALPFPKNRGALLRTNPTEIADRLAESGQLPDLTDAVVVLAAAGDTAAPQSPLPPPARQALIDLWTAVLHRAGAEVRVDQTPSTGQAQTGLPPVTPVPVSAPPPITPIVLTEQAVGFLPDVATLRDPAAAAAVIAPIAITLKANPQQIQVVGTTADVGSVEGQILLSTQRSEAVRNLLVAAGVDPATIEVRGMGSELPTFVPDRDATGKLDPILAARNRQVIIKPE